MGLPGREEKGEEREKTQKEEKGKGGEGELESFGCRN